MNPSGPTRTEIPAAQLLHHVQGHDLGTQRCHGRLQLSHPCHRIALCSLRRRSLAVSFQQVVHSALTEEAEVVTTVSKEDRMDIHQNARLTPHGRASSCGACWSWGQAHKAVAMDLGVNVKTVNKWCARFRAEGAAGLIDRSSRPPRLRQPTPDAIVEQIAALRRQRWTGDQIAKEVGVSPATVSRVLRRLGLSRLKGLAPAAPIRRYSAPARRADPPRHQEARPLRADRPPHHRRARRPAPRRRLGVRPRLPRRRLAHRLRPGPARRAPRQRRRLPARRPDLLCEPRRQPSCAS